MLVIAYRSRSSQLAAAARLLSLSWAFSIQLWIVMDGPERSVAFGLVDFLLACAFFQMSRRRWFPVPLFFLHAALVIYHLYAALVDSSIWWIALFLNRAFELAVGYVIACSAYRVYIQQTKNAARR